MNISGLHNNYNFSQNYNLNKKSYTKPQDETVTPSSSEVSFKGGKESKIGKWISEFYGKYYGKPMYDKEWIQTASRPHDRTHVSTRINSNKQCIYVENSN